MNDQRIYLAASLCALHINSGSQGFRQRDVKFYFSLFTNWMESYLGSRVFLQNTQIQRYLDNQVKRGILQKSKSKTPSYSYKNTALLNLIEEITTINPEDHLELFFFQLHLLDLYKDVLFEAAVKEKLNLTPNLTLELKYLLDRKVFISKQRSRIQKEIERLNARKNESILMSKLADKLFSSGKPFDKVVKAIEAEYPYELNNYVKMTELFPKLHPSIRKAELTTNVKKRADLLWGSLFQMYEDYLKRLDAIS